MPHPATNAVAGQAERRLGEFLERFDQAWQGADWLELKEFLESVPPELRAAALPRLVARDLYWQWQRLAAPKVEDYLRTWPELAQDPDDLVRLFFEEYCVRQQCGDKVAAMSYESRFKDLGQAKRFPAFLKLAEEASGESLVRPAPADSGESKRPSRATDPGEGEEAFLYGNPGFKVVEEIGSGNFGTVYKAKASGGWPAAVKVIWRPVNSVAARRELRALEALTGLRLNCSFLVQIFFTWIENNQLHIAMELADRSLEDRLKECPNGIPLEELLGYIRDVAEALDYLHDNNIIHRDIKPANLLLCGAHAKIGDYGLVREGDLASLVAGTQAGTPGFWAPEVGEMGCVSPRQSDQYSLAVTYVMLRQGRLPHRGPRHLETPLDLSGLEPVERVVVARALAWQHHDRFPTCKDFHQALVESTRGHQPGSITSALADTAKISSEPTLIPEGEARSTVTTVEPAPARAAEPPRTRRRNLLLFAVMFLVAGLAVAGAFLGNYLLAPNGDLAIRPEPTIPSVIPGPEPGKEPGTDVRKPGPPPPPVHKVDFLPPGFQPARDAREVRTEEGWLLYDQIVLQKGPLEVVFVLVPRVEDADPPSFYIQRDKVWNELYREFMKFEPGLETRWKEGAWLDISQPLDITPRPGASWLFARWPVCTVSYVEARKLASWLAEDGHIPTARQWDRAAERPANFFPGLIPFVSSYAVARHQQGPQDVGDAILDRSRWGCSDMAGNGREWTSTLITGEDLSPGAPVDPKEYLQLRGHSYLKESPRDFSKPVLAQRSDRLSPVDSRGDIGFRVALKIVPRR